MKWRSHIRWKVCWAPCDCSKTSMAYASLTYPQWISSKMWCRKTSFLSILEWPTYAGLKVKWWSLSSKPSTVFFCKWLRTLQRQTLSVSFTSMNQDSTFVLKRHLPQDSARWRIFQEQPEPYHFPYKFFLLTRQDPFLSLSFATWSTKRQNPDLPSISCHKEAT